MQILSIYNNQVLRGTDEEREKWINIVRTIFFPRRTYEKNTLETTMVGMRSYGSTQKLNIPC